MNKLVILTIFFVSLITSSFAQSTLTTFNSKPEVFIGQAKDLFNQLPDKKVAREHSASFEEFWNSGQLSADQKAMIINHCVHLSDKRARVASDYDLYFTTIQAALSNNKVDAESFAEWNEAFTGRIENKRYSIRDIMPLVKTLHDLIYENTLYSSNTIKWKASTDNWKLISDDDSLKVQISNTDLTCYAIQDSMKIYNTSGILNCSSLAWHGSKGKVSWERSNFSPDSVFALLPDFYKINFKQYKYEASGVEFTNKKYIQSSVFGSLKEKVYNSKNPERIIYPQFVTDTSDVNLPNIFPNIDYKGGFTQMGTKFVATSPEGEVATVIIKRRGIPFIIAKSNSFAIRESSITTQKAETEIILDSTEIYHPGALFRYMAKDNTISLSRNEDGLSESPFFDFFHNLSFEVGRVHWTIGSDSLILEKMVGSKNSYGFFESISYFKPEIYRKLQGVDNVHPLIALNKFSEYNYQAPFSCAQYAKSRGLPANQLRQQVIQFAIYGFVKYNTSTDMVEVTEKTRQYLLFNAGAKDYDVMNFEANTSGEVPIAIIDLSTFDMDINGVKHIRMSDKQRTAFLPENQKIEVRKDRNIIFDGTILAGMSTLYGSSFNFNYNDFAVNMDKIDSVKFKALTEGMNDIEGLSEETLSKSSELRDVNSVVQDLSGTLYIDNFDNKSGKLDLPQYPILDSKQESYVYYTNAGSNTQTDSTTTDSIESGYNPEDFNFKLDTFKLIGLNHLTKENLQFKGTLNSQVFEPLNDTIGIMPDFSLGFKRYMPEGTEIYEGQATFNNYIALSNEGLKGDGTINYLNSTVISEDFTFMPSETKGVAQSFIVDRIDTDVTYPDVVGTNVGISYLPFEEELHATTLDNDSLVMYDEQAAFKGVYSLTDKGSSGDGTVILAKGYLNSNVFEFENTALAADSSDLHINSQDSLASDAFNTSKLITKIDFDEQYGNFISPDGSSVVNFNENKFTSTVAEFNWDMASNNLYLGEKGSGGSLFQSSRHSQDSLSFLVPYARYNIEDKAIYALGVEEIDVADATIQLGDSGKVNIMANAEIDPLINATILIKKTNHTIYDSKVKVLGRYEYTGQGKYGFTNGSGTEYKLIVEKIGADKKNPYTSASGIIIDEDNFKLDDHFAYEGEFKLNAADSLLYFDGAARPIYKDDSKAGTSNFVKFESHIDPNNIIIPIKEESQNKDFENIYKSFFISTDSAHIYSAFLDSREFYSDDPMITAADQLIFNDETSAFEIKSTEQIENPLTKGPIFSSDYETGNLTAFGEINFGIDLNDVKMSGAGEIKDIKGEENIKLSTLLLLDFFVNNDARDEILNIVENSSSTKVKADKGLFRKRLSELMDSKKVNDVVELIDGDEKGGKNINELYHLFTFENLDMEFDGKYHCYRVNTTTNITTFNGKPLNREVKINAEIYKKRSGNTFDMLLRFDDSNWVYFSYADKMLQTVSSNQMYNDIIQGVEIENAEENTESDSKEEVADTDNTEVSKKEKKKNKKNDEVKEDDSDDESEKVKSKKAKKEEKLYNVILAPNDKVNNFNKKFKLTTISISNSAAGQNIKDK